MACIASYHRIVVLFGSAFMGLFGSGVAVLVPLYCSEVPSWQLVSFISVFSDFFDGVRNRLCVPSWQLLIHMASHLRFTLFCTGGFHGAAVACGEVGGRDRDSLGGTGLHQPV